MQRSSKKNKIAHSIFFQFSFLHYFTYPILEPFAKRYQQTSSKGKQHNLLYTMLPNNLRALFGTSETSVNNSTN